MVLFHIFLGLNGFDCKYNVSDALTKQTIENASAIYDHDQNTVKIQNVEFENLYILKGQNNTKWYHYISNKTKNIVSWNHYETIPHNVNQIEERNISISITNHQFLCFLAKKNVFELQIGTESGQSGSNLRNYLRYGCNTGSCRTTRQNRGVSKIGFDKIKKTLNLQLNSGFDYSQGWNFSIAYNKNFRSTMKLNFLPERVRHYHVPLRH